MISVLALKLDAGNNLTVSGNVVAGELDLDAVNGAIAVNNSLDTAIANGDVAWFPMMVSLLEV